MQSFIIPGIKIAEKEKKQTPQRKTSKLCELEQENWG